MPLQLINLSNLNFMNTIAILSENINNCKLPDVEKKTNIVSLVAGLLLIALAVVLFVMSGKVESNLGSSTEVFFGVIAIGVALYLVLGQRNKMVDMTTDSVVSKDHIYFGTNDLHDIKVALANNDFDGFDNVRRQPDGNVQVIFYFSRDNRYIAIQVQKYEPFEYKPCSEVYVFRGDDAERLIGKLKSSK